MKVKVSELSGSALDWAVAKAEGFNMDKFYDEIMDLGHSLADIYSPSTLWAQAGEIITREKIAIDYTEYGDERDDDSSWCASVYDYTEACYLAPTPLLAAMRCFVASRLGLGHEIEIPDNLI